MFSAVSRTDNCNTQKKQCLLQIMRFAHTSDRAADLVQFRSLFPFLIISFGLAWGILLLFVCLPSQMTERFGQLTGQHPLFYLAVYSPAIAALLLVVNSGGARAIQAFLSRLLLWRCRPGWYVFMAFGIPLIYVAGSALKGNILDGPSPFQSFQMFLVAFFYMAIKGPVEELGWRGLALPLLQRKLAPIWAGLVLGAIWGGWHLPAFLMSGTPQGSWSFLPFFVGAIAVSIIMTQLFNASRGSILLSSIFHLQLINPVWPDAQPYDTPFFVVAAGIVVWVNRKEMFGKEGGVINVIP